MKRISRRTRKLNKKVKTVLAYMIGYSLFALFVIGVCELRDWNIENQCNRGIESMCEIMEG